MGALCILNLSTKLFIITAVISLNNDQVKYGLIASAKVIVRPLWDVSANVTNPCIVNDSSSDEIQIVGSPDHSCTLQVNASEGTHVQLQVTELMNDSVTDSYMYLKHTDELENCVNKYLVINDLSGICGSVITTRQTQMTVYGYARLSIHGKSAERSLSECLEDQNTTYGRANQSSNCINIRGYSDKVTCWSEESYSGYCRIYFMTVCDVVLGPREAIFECNNNDQSQNQKLFIPFPDGVFQEDFIAVLSLDFEWNSITKLMAGCFTGLHTLEELSFSGNKISELSEGCFNGLPNLKLLSLSGNRLRRVPPETLQNLVNLEVLSLGGNRLSRVPPETLQNLVNLEVLSLGGNQIATINAQHFQHLNKLTGLDLSSNLLTSISLTHDIFWGLVNLERLGLSDNGISELHMRLFQGLSRMTSLHLNRIVLRTLPGKIFKDLSNLVILHIAGNFISELNRECFLGLHKLTFLNLEDNMIGSLSEGVFQDLINLKSLHLSYNQIIALHADCFQGLDNVRSLTLYDNKLNSLPEGMFQSLGNIPELVINNNPLTMTNHRSFSSLPESLNIYVSQHEICECFIPHESIYCVALDIRSPYLTCGRLLSDKTLAVLMWIIGFNAFAGNLFVLIWRNKGASKNKVNVILLSNFAVSDFLMGIYMVIIGSADIFFGDSFPMQAETWRTGITCRVAGALSIISSEASVFFVMLISIDRFICIRFPYSTRKLTRKSISILVILIWMVSLGLGIIPSVLAGKNYKFYDNSHVCIGLPLALAFYSKFDQTVLFRYISVEAVGHYYSTALFLGLNAVCYLVVLGCYIEIVRAVLKSSKRAGRSPDMAEQLKLTRKVTAVVATDFFCWAPVIIAGILVQTRVTSLPASVFAWCVTFVLPINSAINPYVYTIADAISKYRNKQLKK